jgi:quercetin dioxygenase-like cupin family protein
MPQSGLTMADWSASAVGAATMAGDLGWRCVVAAHRDGRPVFQSDANLRVLETQATTRLGSIISLPGPPTSADDGMIDTVAAETGPGSVTIDAIIVEATQQGPIIPDAGSPDSLEAYIVVRGQVRVTVGPDEAVLHPGQVFLPRGRPHSIRASDGEETRLVRVRCVADPGTDAALPTTVRSSSGPSQRVRRVVAGTDATGRPVIMQDGDPAVMFVIGDQSDPDVGLADVWELGGLVGSVEQGGDASDPWELEPRASGMKILNLELKPVEVEGSPITEGGWHATATIDVDIVIDGVVDMYLPDLPSVTLRPGDTLIQRGTSHLWRAVGDRSLRMVTVMLGVGPRPLPGSAS